MSNISEALKNLEMALAELKATIEAEQMVDPEEVANQRTLDLTNIRF